jgi:hypothetical protein
MIYKCLWPIFQVPTKALTKTSGTGVLSSGNPNLSLAS